MNTCNQRHYIFFLSKLHNSQNNLYALKEERKIVIKDYKVKKCVYLF